MTNIVILLILIVLVKAIFSAFETALIYINKAEIKQLSKTDKKAEKIKNLLEDSNKFFGVIEVGIITCEFLASTIVSVTFLEIFIKYLYGKNLEIIIADTIGIIVVTLILSYVMLVFGSLIPKKIAKNHPKKVAYKFVSTIWIITKINYPFERLIDFSTNIFSKIFKIEDNTSEKMTEQQLKMIISEAKDEGVLENIEKKIFNNTIKANDVIVQKSMVPLEQTIMIDINWNFEEIIKVIKQSKFSRIPVYDKERENIIGILYLKDAIIKYTETGLKNKEDVKELLRKPNYIFKGERLFSAFRNIQKENRMIGIVTNEICKPIGIITIEDIIEKVAGKITDEDDI